MIPLYDAHNHLQNPRLAGAIDSLPEIGLKMCVVNGTSEKDWPQVSALAKKHDWILPAFGLHPWYIADRSANWFDTLRRLFDQHPNATIGEIGLDRWMRDPDIPDQEKVFRQQLALADERNLTVTIHCLKAWGSLEESLASNTKPFLLHSYGGSHDMMRIFTKLNGYFSFSGYFADEKKSVQREVFKKIPLNRLLLETDAPDMLPPLALQTIPADYNHPRNIQSIYNYAATLWNIPEETLAQTMEQNFRRLFLAPK
jgi:TatD DNase family protein